jgi:tetratricopeptide (TPR) repeat protein
MSKMKRLKSAGLLCAALFLFAMAGNAQTKEDVVKAFNEGVAAFKTNDFVKATASFQQSIDLATKVGTEADTLRGKAEKIVPGLQFKVAAGVIGNKASTSADMLASLQKTIDLATKYGDDETAAKAKRVIPQIYTKMATDAFKANDLAKSLTYFDKVIELDPNNVKALVSKGVIYRKQNATDLNVETMQKVIELGTKLSDTVSVKGAKDILEAEYIKRANAAYVKSDFKGAIPMAYEALKYDPKNATAYYILAFSHNKLKEYDEALDAIEKGIPFENQAKEQLARFYYEKGVALKAKGDKDKALEAFKLASFGKFLSPAALQIKDINKPAVPAKK